MTLEKVLSDGDEDLIFIFEPFKQGGKEKENLGQNKTLYTYVLMR